MACYTVGHITVHDPENYKNYAAQVPATIEAHGGKYLVRGGHATDVEGEMPGDRHVVVEWPDRATAEGWYNSDEYQKILPIRLGASKGVMTIVDGFDG